MDRAEFERENLSASGSYTIQEQQWQPKQNTDPTKLHITIDGRAEEHSFHIKDVINAETIVPLDSQMTDHVSSALDATTFVQLLSRSTMKSSKGNDPLNQGNTPLASLLNSENKYSNLSANRLYGRVTRAMKSFLPFSPSPPQPGDLNHNKDRQQCVSSATSIVASHFSDLTLSSASSSVSTCCFPPLTAGVYKSNDGTSNTASSSPFTASDGTSAISPTISTKATTKSPMSSVYFPPSASALHQKRRKAKKHALHVPRPKNCFMLYRSKVLPMIMVELGMINNRIISKIAAERWSAEAESVKTWYRQMAKKGKEEHLRNNPGYKYAPHKKILQAADGSMGSVDYIRRQDGEGPKNESEVDDSDCDFDGGDGDLLGRAYADGVMQPRQRSERRYAKALSNSNSVASSKRTKMTSTHPSFGHKKARENEDWSYPGRCNVTFASSASKGDGDGFVHRRRSRGVRGETCGGSQSYSVDLSSYTRKTAPLMAFQELGSSSSPNVPMPVMGFSLIEQGLYLAWQENEKQRLLLQQQRQQQEQQEQQEQLSSMYPVLPFTAFSAAVTQVQGSSLMYGLSDSANVSSATLVDPLPGSSSLYGLPDSASASSATLVDPVNHWTTHRYNDPSTVMGQIGPPSQRATQLGTAGQGVSLSKIQQQFYGKASPTHGNNSGLRKEEYQGALDKDLPPLPIEATVMTSNDDPNAILSHLYSEYNSNASISPSWVTPLEGFAAQLIAAKEADSDSTMGVMSLGESSGELAQWQQQTYLGGEQKDGQQLQYLIKPACPVRYMSFADVGHESMSMMDVFSWPSDSSSSSNSSNSSNSSGS